MKKAVLILIMVIVGSLLVFGFAVSQQEPETTEADTVKKEAAQEDTSKKEDTTKVVHKYIGNTKCKMCHNTKAKGLIWDTWSKTKHSTAYATLANEESKAIGKKMKIEEPQKDAKCLKCHVSGYGQSTSDKYSMEEGVGCEGCHGPGENYWAMKVMKDKKLALENGLVEPDEKLCATCHNEESPTYKPLKFKEAYKLVEHHPPAAEEK
jgi:Zn finger protein HypA/HybF involved in hydrogenase expression